MSPIPAIQRAWVEERRGSPSESLRLRADWPVPTALRSGEVLVKVQACGLNPAGYKIMGFFPDLLRGRPIPSGMDLAGVIIDSNDTEYSNGDEIYGFMTLGLCKSTKQGALSEYVRLPTTHFVLRPPAVTPIEAAGICMVSFTAYTALVELAQIEAGQTVFIYGASSGVGLAAIRIAKSLGAKVVASASGKNEALVRDVGADEFLDYTARPIHEALISHPPSPKFNVIFEAVGISDPALYTHSPAYLAPNGVFVSNGPFPKDTSTSELWNVVKTVVAIRSLNLPIDTVFDFKDVVEGYVKQMTKRARGKIVVRVDPTV
ncbi:hypothetical protein DXG01_007004 [Tephrocybe rancida]|nr:hypothetical protein DXG01_007004 [Tephrocybe rancida]